MIPYIVGKLAPNSTRFMSGLVKHIPGIVSFLLLSPAKRGPICDIPAPLVERLARKAERHCWGTIGC